MLTPLFQSLEYVALNSPVKPGILSPQRIYAGCGRLIQKYEGPNGISTWLESLLCTHLLGLFYNRGSCKRSTITLLCRRLLYIKHIIPKTSLNVGRKERSIFKTLKDKSAYGLEYKIKYGDQA